MAKTIKAATDRVDISLPRAHFGEEASQFVGINGVSYIVPKGKTVNVRPEVAEELRRAETAEAYMHAQAEKMRQRSNV